MAKKRTTRKQLLKEPDEFITMTGKIIRFAQKYRTQILGVIGGIVVIILFIAGLNSYLNYSETRAFALLDKGISQYEISLKSNGPQKAYQDVCQHPVFALMPHGADPQVAFVDSKCGFGLGQLDVGLP